MAKLSIKEIQNLAIQIVQSRPGGVRYTELCNTIVREQPETPPNTVAGSVVDLATRFPERISKPTRGLYVSAGSPDRRAEVSEVTAAPPLPAQVREEDFYAPFAEWLKSELDEATVAVALGGASIQKKWGTPDVLGVYKPRASDRMKFDIEIIAAEIKVDPQQPVVAFGQAAAYRLFAAKSYVVMPATVSGEDYGRLEALCMLFGVGLVLFEANTEAPDFRIRVRAQRFSPDMFYVNEFAERIHRSDPATFEKLFG